MSQDIIHLKFSLYYLAVNGNHCGKFVQNNLSLNKEKDGR